MSPELIQALGGLGGLATFITAAYGVFATLRVKKDTKELQNNHGSSLRDGVDRVEALVGTIVNTAEMLNTRVEANSVALQQIQKDITDERHERQQLDKRALEEHQRMWDAINCAPTKHAQMSPTRQYQRRRK